MIILIPAYRPDAALPALCQQLLASPVEELEILVVDDGSGPAYTPIFDSLRTLGGRVHLLTLGQNGGKGAALRAGISWVLLHRPGRPLVTADADGQHLPADILAVGRATQDHTQAGDKALVLGVRTLEDAGAPEASRAPLRSRWGNAVTAGFFRLATGYRVADTQTGLRGLTPSVLHWAQQQPGDRYDYEFTLLLRASRTDILLDQLPITRVYEPGNPTSHFQPVRDSLRIYMPLVLFLLASFAGFLTDTLALLLLVFLGMGVGPAVVAARVVSALVNYAMNRWVMADGGAKSPHSSSLVRYGLLAVGLLAVNAALMEALTFVGLNLLLAKVLVEVLLLPVSFAVQRRWVFQEGAGRAARTSHELEGSRILVSST